MQKENKTLYTEQTILMEPLHSYIMGEAFFYLALLTLLFYFIMGTQALFGVRTLRFLRDCSPAKREDNPRLSVIIAARNEKKNIETALQSVLNQDYSNIEIIVVDDRSTDGTSDILDRITLMNPRLKVFHISELPDGWLGKNHALCFGGKQSTGDYLLFSDADVVMDPTTVSRAIRYMIEKKLDHLTIFPELKIPGVLLNMVVGAFTILFGLFTKPWKAKDPRSHKHIGIGAFNLVRTDVYKAIGFHHTIAMRPDDDMKLGKIIKKHGFRQDCLLGLGMISVEWYSSLKELINGLMKNSFASVDYQILVIMGATVVNLSFFVWPFFGVFLTSGVTQLINLIILIILALICLGNALLQGIKPWYGIGFPIGNLIFIYILWVTTLTTIFRKGIYWRGTYYCLAKLKANKI